MLPAAAVCEPKLIFATERGFDLLYLNKRGVNGLCKKRYKIGMIIPISIRVFCLLCQEVLKIWFCINHLAMTQLNGLFYEVMNIVIFKVHFSHSLFASKEVFFEK